MQLLQWLIIALAGVIVAGCSVRIALLALAISANPEQKSSYQTQMKNAVVVLIIALVVGVSPVVQNIIFSYFKGG